MNKPRILIVEDEPIIGIDLQNTLISLGYDVPAVIPSAEEALRKVTERKPDLILMDIFLSGEMDGIEAAKRIQESYDIPIIYLTAHTEETAFTRARETSPYGFLVKPTGRSDLYTAVETALNRHALEIRMQESEKKYREMVENINDVIYTLDRDGNITYISPIIEKISQYRVDELVGSSFSEFIHPDDLNGIRESYLRTIAGTGEPSEYRMLDKDGSVRYVRTSSTVIIRGDTFTGINGIMTDITDKRKAEEELNRSRRILESIARTIPNILYRLDASDTIVFINDAVKEYGYNPEEVIGKNIMEFVHPDDREKAKHRVNERRTRERRTHNLEIRLFSKRKIEAAADEQVERVFLVHCEGLYTTEEPRPETFMGSQGIAYDITDQKQTEDALRESEEKYRHIFENIQDVYYETSPDGIILELSPSIESFSRFRREELIGRSMYEIYVAPDERDILQRAKLSSPTESVRDYVIRLKDKNGAVRYGSINSKIIRDEHGTPLKNVGSLRDITERRNMEEALLESEQKYRELVEDLNDVIYAVDLEGTITYISPAVQSLFGYTPEDLIGKNFLPYVHEEDRDRIVEGFMRSLQNIHQPAEYRMITKSGAIRWFRVFERTILDGDKPVGTRGVLTDITEKKKKEKELQESEEKYRLVSENIPVAVYSALPDEHSTSLFISGRIDDLTGYTADQFLTNPEFWIQVIHPDDRASVLEKLEEHRTRRIPLDIEYRIVTRDNVIKWIKDKATPFIEDNRIVRIDGFMEDITEKKLAEDRIRESLAEKEILLKEVHHRVKNNFQIIMSLLQLQTQGAPDEHVIEALRDSQNRIRSMALVHEKLYQSEDFARINFSEYINIMTRELYQSYSCDPKRIRLQVTLAEIFLEISKAIPCGLIINELISNAIKHAFNDNRKKGEITLGLKEKGNSIMLTISDNGRGIPETVNIEEPKTLGLKLVTTLVKNQLKGELELKRKGGTEFIVRFETVSS